MVQVSSCGAAQCAIIKGVLLCLMDLSEFQYLENECLEGSHVSVYSALLYCRISTLIFKLHSKAGLELD